MIKQKSVRIKYTAYVATSIDGRIAKSSKSSVDWTSKEDWNFFQNGLKKVDAVIVGHNTFKASENHLRCRNAIVLTSKVNVIKVEGNTFFLNPEKYSIKKFLQTKNYKKVAILGGSKVYDFCLRHKMIDDLFVTIEPYVFTNGVPMFSGIDFKKNRFSLQSIKKLNKTGTILLKYKVKN